MAFLSNKQILITGLLSNRSLSYGIAQAMHREGARLAFTYQNESIKDRVAELAKEFGSDLLFACDVTDDQQITKLFEDLGQQWDHLDGLIHSIAFVTLNAFAGTYLETVDRENFRIAHDVASYSLAALAKAAVPLLEKSQGSILTLSYRGSVNAVPGYNVMGLAKASLESNVRYLANDLGPKGIRVNAISAGPYKSLSTARSKMIDKNIKHYAKYSPLRRNVSLLEVGNAAAFLTSDLASGITGEITYVDGGYNIMDVNTHE